MTKLSSARLIGLFVLGGIIVLVILLMLFGSGEYFKPKKRFVLYFEDSLSGLNVGAAVKFRGVTVGKVVDISIQSWDDYMYVYTPVIVELYVNQFHLHHATRSESSDFGKLIKKGLKAKLSPESFVTGVLYIELDFYPNKPSFFRDIKHVYPEIPTVISDFKQLEEKLENLQIDKLVTNLREASNSISKFFSNPQLVKTITQLDHSLKSAEHLTENLNQQVTPLSDEFKITLKEMQKTLNEINTALPEITDNTNEFVKDAKRAINQLEYTLSEQSPVYVDTLQALEDFSKASQSINNLADYLEQHPGSIIWGK